MFTDQATTMFNTLPLCSVFSCCAALLSCGQTDEMSDGKVVFEFPYITENLGDITRSEDLLQAIPTQENEQLLYFTALPSGLNCSFFNLPAVRTVIPTSLQSVIGEAVNVNFYGESESACED